MHFNLNPSRVFYGWWVVAAVFLIALYVGGVIYYGFTTIFKPIADELGWSYTQISLAASLRGMEMGLLAPLTGILVDRWGPRRLIFSGAIIASLGLIILSRVTSLGMFYAAFFLIAVGMSACTQTVIMTAVTNWFKKDVGIATGIASCGFGFGGLLIPVMVTLIDMYGWRMTMTILALGMLAIVLPLSILVRHKPEQYGYLPDGEVKSTVMLEDGLAPLQTVEVDFRAKQAIKTSTFWYIALAFACQIVIVSAVQTHILPYLISIGVAKSTSSLVATATALISIGGRLGLGWLGDKFDRKLLAAGAFAMVGLGMFCFGYASNLGIWLFVPFITFYGIGYGGLSALRPSLTRQFFGRMNFGTVFGLIIGINAAVGIIGPPLAGWVYDQWGSYQGIWFVFAGLAIAALIGVLTIPPQHKNHSFVEEPNLHQTI